MSLTVKVPPLNTLLTGYLTPAIKQNIYNNKEKIDNFKHLMALLAEFDGLKKNKKKSVSVFSEVDTHQIDTLKTQKHIEHIKKKQPNTIVQNATVVWGIIKDNYKQSKKPVSYELVKEQSKMEDKEIDEALKFLEPKGDILEEPAGFFISL